MKNKQHIEKRADLVRQATTLVDEGTARVRRNHVESGFGLGAWCHNQRGTYRRGAMPPDRAPVWKPLLAGTGTHGPTFLMHLAPDKSGHVPKSALRDRVPGVRVGPGPVDGGKRPLAERVRPADRPGAHRPVTLIPAPRTSRHTSPPAEVEAESGFRSES